VVLGTTRDGPPFDFGLFPLDALRTTLADVQPVEKVISCDGPADRGPGFGATIAMIIGIALPSLLAVGTQPANWLVLDVPVAVLSCALAPLLLTKPEWGALAIAVLAAVSPGASPAATVATLLVAQRRRFAIAVGTGMASVVAHIVREVWRPVGNLPMIWWIILVLAVHAALVSWGALAQARRALLASLRERAERAETDQGRRVAEARVLERTRLAREMHDTLAHRLSLLATYAGALEYRPDSAPERLARAAGVIREGVHQALVELRDVIGVLRDTDGVAGDEAIWPQPMLADLPKLVDESLSAGTLVSLERRVDDVTGLPGIADRTAYRVVQESLTNARKHASGQPVRVLLDGEPGAQLVIDIRNPLPADPTTPPTVPGAGTGLVGLTERVQLAGGKLEHEVTSSGEFLVRASLPWPA
jgi:signal transduction histidine kinase